MVKFLLRLRHKIFLFIFIIAFALVIFAFKLPFIFKEPFLDIKDTIEESVGDALDKKVSIEGIDFLPYGELILNNIKIYDRENILCVSVKRAHIRSKLLPLLINRTIIITKATFIEPVFFPSSRNLRIVQGRKTTFSKYKLKLDGSLVVKVESGGVIFNDSDSTSDSIGFSFWARLKEGKKLYSEGWIDLKEYHLKDYLLNDIFFFEFIDKIRYKLRTSLIDNTCLVDELLLDFEQFKIEITGLIENYNVNPVLNLKLTLRELDFLEKLFLKSKLFMTHIGNFIVHIKGALKEPRWSVSLDMLRSKFTYLPMVAKIDNFYCNLKFSKEGLLIDDLSCFLNDFPIGLKCKLSNFESPYIELSLISYPGQLPSLRLLNPFNFEFYFSGYKYENSIRGKVSFQIEKLISTRPRKVHNVKITVSDLLCKFSDKIIPSTASKNTISLLIDAKNIVYETDIPNAELRFDLAGLTFSQYPEGTRIYFADLNLSGYEGFLKGNGFLDFESLPPRYFLDFELSKFNMAELANILHLDYDLAGDLSGKCILDSKAFSYLVGEAAISNGHIKNLKLLDSIADFLSVISIKDIYFEDFSSNFSFSVAGDEISLDKIRLHSKDIYLDANLKFKDKGKVKGNVLVRLSTRLLGESFKLRKLFFLMSEKLPYADFEFEIGGFIGSHHIRWLETKFKKILMRYLSKRREEALEEQVEEAIKLLLENR